MKIWPTNYHLDVDDLEKNYPPSDHDLGQIFKLRSRKLPISTTIMMTKIIMMMLMVMMMKASMKIPKLSIV